MTTMMTLMIAMMNLTNYDDDNNVDEDSNSYDDANHNDDDDD